LWFTDPGTNRIGRMSLDGKVLEYPIPTPASDPEGMTAGPDGAVWFTEHAVDQIGRVALDGTVTEYLAPWVRPTPSGFKGITAGPDGALWFTEEVAGAIGRMTLAGAFNEYPLTVSAPNAITAGPDGALWFTENPATIGRIGTDGKVTEFGPRALNSYYGDITAGADGALWFLVNNTVGPVQLGRITPTGQERFVDVPAPYGLGGIALGADGNLWFTETGGNAIGQYVHHTPVFFADLEVSISIVNLTGPTTQPSPSSTGSDTSLPAAQVSATEVVPLMPLPATEASLVLAQPGQSADLAEVLATAVDLVFAPQT
jgi:virginiamycin B lyase